MSPPQTDCEPALPGANDHPQADLVIFDGDCEFCCAQVQRLHRWDGKGRLAFKSLHDPDVAQYVPDLSHDELMREMLVLTRDGRRFGGAKAFRYLSRRLPKLWWLVPLIHVPGSLPFWNWAYQTIALHRYRFNSGWHRGTCSDGRCKLRHNNRSTD